MKLLSKQDYLEPINYNIKFQCRLASFIQLCTIQQFSYMHKKG